MLCCGHQAAGDGEPLASCNCSVTANTAWPDFNSKRLAETIDFDQHLCEELDQYDQLLFDILVTFLKIDIASL